jgi:two-component system OmpR family response regulator
MHVLIVEDDTVLADGLTHALRRAGYAVDACESGSRADHALAAGTYDLVVLDVELPALDGFEVLRRLRARKSKTPVLMLTARDALHDRVKGLDLGADDYVVKPFEMAEIEARVRALIRRSQGASDNEIVVGNLHVDVEGRVARVGNAPLDLLPREFAVLEVLMRRAGRVVLKDTLLSSLYEWRDEVGPNAIEVQVHRLRKKLAEAEVDIRTVRGLGYLLEARKEAAEA